MSTRLCSSDKARLLARAGKDQNLRDALFLLTPQFPLTDLWRCPLSQQVGSEASQSNKTTAQLLQDLYFANQPHPPLQLRPFRMDHR